MSDIVNAKNSKEVLFKIYMYAKEKTIPNYIKELLAKKLALEPSFIDVACEMLYMINNDGLLKRDKYYDYEIFRLVINAPLLRTKCIVSTFKEVDLSQRNDVIDFIKAVISANGEKQAECAAKFYKTFIKELLRIREIKEGIKNNKLPLDATLKSDVIKILSEELYIMETVSVNGLTITNLIASCEEDFQAEYICNFAISGDDDRDKSFGFYLISEEPKTMLDVIKVMSTAKGIKQLQGIKKLYFDWMRLTAYSDFKQLNIKQLSIIANAKGDEQVAVAMDYLYEKESEDLVEIIANCEGKVQLYNVLNYLQCYRRLHNNNFAVNLEYCRKIGFAKSGKKSSCIYQIIKSCEYEKFHKYRDEIIEIISKIEDDEIVNLITYVALNDGIKSCLSGLRLKYIEAMAKSKDVLTTWILALHITGNYQDEENPIELDENRKQIIINILKESGLGFAHSLTRAIWEVEAIVNSKIPVKVTLKTLMKLPVDMIEHVLHSQDVEELGAYSKVLLFNK